MTELTHLTVSFAGRISLFACCLPLAGTVHRNCLHGAVARAMVSTFNTANADELGPDWFKMRYAVFGVKVAFQLVYLSLGWLVKGSFGFFVFKVASASVEMQGGGRHRGVARPCQCHKVATHVDCVLACQACSSASVPSCRCSSSTP